MGKVADFDEQAKALTLVEQVKSYFTGPLHIDLLSGLTIAIVLIPQGIAYAALAELPP